MCFAKAETMKMKTLIAATLAVAMSGLVARSQDYRYTPMPESDLLFHANELTLDLFGTASVNQETLNHISGERVHHNGRLGLGAGLTYYATRYLGVGGDAYSENPEHSFVDNASGNLYLRLPMDQVHLAPYIYGGGGHQFDPNDKWFGQAGAGLDIRVTRQWGFYVDGRYVMPEDVSNFGVFRAGIRLVF